MNINKAIRILEFIVIFIPVTILYLFALAVFIPLMLRDGDIPSISLGLLLAAPCLFSCYRIFTPVMLRGIGALNIENNKRYIWLWLGCVLSLGALLMVAFEPYIQLNDDDLQHIIRMWAVGSLLNIPLVHIFVEYKLFKVVKRTV